MRELTLDEIEAVSGGVSLADLWNGLKSAFSSAGDFFGFDGHFGYQGGDGGLSFGGFGSAVGEAAGYAWAAPNTAIGLVIGGLGWAYDHTFGDHVSGVEITNGVIQFTDNPFLSSPGDFNDGAITFGHVQIYGDNTASAVHEMQHTYQYEQWGPFFLPAYVLSGFGAMIQGGSFIGSGNFFESGPYSNPPTPY
ncbi:MAG TPA: hypothetical protein VF633_06870 [Brevundimonas sp.]|jgi:hypothetical protein